MSEYSNIINKHHANQSSSNLNSHLMNLQKINSTRGIHKKSKSITYEFVNLISFLLLFEHLV